MKPTKKRRWRSLTAALEELERTDPEVRRAAEKYERTKTEILHRLLEKQKPLC
jgi:hypothetical protein